MAEGDPSTPGFTVPDLLPPLAVDARRLNHRRALLDRVDRYRKRAALRANAGAKTISAFQQKAFDLMTSPATRAAFDISAEPIQSAMTTADTRSANRASWRGG